MIKNKKKWDVFSIYAKSNIINYNLKILILVIIVENQIKIII